MLMICRKQQAVDIIKFTDDFTSHDANKIKNELEYFVCRGESKVMIDLSELKSIDLNAVSLLYHCALKASNRRGGMVLFNPRKKILSILKMARFENIFNVFFSSKLALQALAQ